MLWTYQDFGNWGPHPLYGDKAYYKSKKGVLAGLITCDTGYFKILSI